MEVFERKFITIVIPAYNEEQIIVENMHVIEKYMQELDKYNYEILCINDGSKDRTPELADQLALEIKSLRVIHHPINLNLGRALQTGFKNAKGEIIVVLDLDLTYSVDHIDLLLTKQIETGAEVVNASAYMKGGEVSNVPFKRALMSRFANRFMRMASQENYHTFTGMVRAYKTDFIRNLNLKTKDYEINPEIMYKAMILRARIEEVPAHLNWSSIKSNGEGRVSSLRVFKGVFSSLMAGFIFRPYIFFLGLGVVLSLITFYLLCMIFYDVALMYPEVILEPGCFNNRLGAALSQVFDERPQIFLLGGFFFVVTFQLLSLGFIALQNKRYFEESFHLGTSILKRQGHGKD